MQDRKESPAVQYVFVVKHEQDYRVVLSIPFAAVEMEKVKGDAQYWVDSNSRDFGRGDYSMVELCMPMETYLVKYNRSTYYRNEDAESFLAENEKHQLRRTKNQAMVLAQGYRASRESPFYKLTPDLITEVLLFSSAGKGEKNAQNAHNLLGAELARKPKK